MHHVDAGQLLQELARHVLAAAGAGVCERELAGVRLGVRDQLLHAAHRQRGVNRDRERLCGHLRYWSEVP
jgi:hypothetical protein